MAAPPRPPSMEGPPRPEDSELRARSEGPRAAASQRPSPGLRLEGQLAAAWQHPPGFSLEGPQRPRSHHETPLSPALAPRGRPGASRSIVLNRNQRK